ncbi:3-keto-5-aminohexanoate cleavage protein [Cognatishimia sp. WU-CL00825]|uniref:3-keto-5-aminohexanoate cleavage protein n=1 Tax=Cognatishimia sp. WU-CL00825 TaxID=3127658 RepID=UPI003104A5AA
MSTPNKFIITCAVTGSIHTPSMSPYLPVTGPEIAKAAIEAAEAGAAVVHLHARNPVDGEPDQSVEAYEPFLGTIKQATDAVVNLTTGGAMTMTVEERAKPAIVFKPEVASLNMGTMNFGLFPMLDRFPDLKHAWERKYLEGSRYSFFRNTFADMEFILTECANNGTRFEIECYDIGHLYTLANLADRGFIKPPFFVQSVFGILGGIGGHEEDIMHMKRTADRLFGDQYCWSVLGCGRNQMRIASVAASMGGNVRVGLEDSLWAGPGKLAKSSAEQVKIVRGILEGQGLEIATPAEAREILDLKGGEKVAF